MEFDKSRVYTALNADELKVGSKVIVADNLAELKRCVAEDKSLYMLQSVGPENDAYRFDADSYVYMLAYLVAEPEQKKLKWTDLKIGDVITNGNEIVMVTGIDTADDDRHIYAGYWWISDTDLANWEKVEEKWRIRL